MTHRMTHARRRHLLWMIAVTRRNVSNGLQGKDDLDRLVFCLYGCLFRTLAGTLADCLRQRTASVVEQLAGDNLASVVERGNVGNHVPSDHLAILVSVELDTLAAH